MQQEKNQFKKREDDTNLADPEVNHKLRDIFKMEKEAKRFWRETQPSSAELIMVPHVI